MQLVTFEAMLVDRLNADGRAQARSFGDLSYPFLYGVAVQVDGGTVPIRLTRGSGTGDPKMTEGERAAHDANIARLKDSRPARMSFTPAQERKASDLIREVLAADLPTLPLFAEELAGSRSGMKVRFSTGAEIYLTPQS